MSAQPVSAPHHAKLIIIGSGPAGYTAAVYAARAMLKPVLISGFEPGGQLMITTDVENYPGFAAAIQGPWLMEQMKAQAEHVGTELVSDHVTEVKIDRAQDVSRVIELKGDSGKTYTCDALIIATGAKAKWLDMPSEEKFKGYGVSACATCDGFFYRGKDVIVVGGGNSAVEEALYLSHLARHVTVVHRRDSFRAEKILQERLFKSPNIKVVWNVAVEEICGTSDPPGVTHVRLKSTLDGGLSEHKVHGVFVAIGHAPAVELFRDKVAFKPNGYIWTAPDSTKTDVPGVYAAGDVTDDIYRQAVTAAGLGCMAALEAERWLSARAAERAPAEKELRAAE